MRSCDWLSGRKQPGNRQLPSSAMPISGGERGSFSRREESSGQAPSTDWNANFLTLENMLNCCGQRQTFCTGRSLLKEGCYIMGAVILRMVESKISLRVGLLQTTLDIFDEARQEWLFPFPKTFLNPFHIHSLFFRLIASYLPQYLIKRPCSVRRCPWKISVASCSRNSWAIGKRTAFNTRSPTQSPGSRIGKTLRAQSEE